MPSQSPRAATTGPRDQRKRPGDLTGVNSQKLAAERDEAQEAALAQVTATKTAERAEKISTVVDYTHGGIKPDVIQVETPSEPMPETMFIRVNYPIEDMTFGKEVVKEAVFDETTGLMIEPPVLGNLQRYDFEEGQQYEVPAELGLHLKRLGYVYDF